MPPQPSVSLSCSWKYPFVHARDNTNGRGELAVTAGPVSVAEITKQLGVKPAARGDRRLRDVTARSATGGGGVGLIVGADIVALAGLGPCALHTSPVI
jgi:hypothetical protein